MQVLEKIQEFMSTPYSNAPIKEALIDIRIEPLGADQLNLIEGICARVKEQYPKKKDRVHFEGTMSVGTQVGASAAQRQVGYVLESADSRFVFQNCLDGFTFSILRPYGAWQELRDEARKLWALYREVLNPGRISRVSVRFINQIDIPQNSIDYKDYFRTTPEVSQDLPQSLMGFFMQLCFPVEQVKGVLVLTQASVPPTELNSNSVVLDINVYTEDAEAFSTEERLWTAIEMMRNLKNEYFERSITDKTRALFGHKEDY